MDVTHSPTKIMPIVLLVGVKGREWTSVEKSSSVNLNDTTRLYFVTLLCDSFHIFFFCLHSAAENTTHMAHFHYTFIHNYFGHKSRCSFGTIFFLSLGWFVCVKRVKIQYGTSIATMWLCTASNHQFSYTSLSSFRMSHASWSLQSNHGPYAISTIARMYDELFSCFHFAAHSVNSMGIWNLEYFFGKYGKINNEASVSNCQWLI